MNGTRGFVNLNRFKSGRTIKQLSKISYDKPKKKERKVATKVDCLANQTKEIEKTRFSRGFGA
ncbi:hypothetical protein ACFLWS_07960 [Chloroflexota bacterium]